MRELPRSNVVKFVPRKLIPDGNSKKPPISNCNGVVQPEKSTSSNVTAVSISNENSSAVRESIVSDISSSRPNSTASERSLSTDDDDSTTECSESGADGSTDEDGGIGENRVPLEPISEETSQRKKSDEDDGLILFFSFVFSSL